MGRRDNIKMHQLPVFFVLIISMFVGSVFPVSQKDGQDRHAVDVATNAKTVPTTTTSSANDNATVASSVKTEENKTENLHSTKAVVPLKNGITSKETTTLGIQKPTGNEMPKHNSTKEAEDMLNSNPSAPHDSGENSDDTSPLSTIESTTTTVAASNKTTTSKTESQAPQTPPDEHKEKDEKKNEINLLNPTETTHQVTYDVASSETSHPSNVNDTGKDVKPAVSHTATSNSSVAPLVADIAANAEPKEVVAEVKPTTHSRNNSMSSGVIALVIAMSFGIAIATVYVGMIVWRRYNEYRYGHRELLVNELEFDTNELRHFEL